MSAGRHGAVVGEGTADVFSGAWDSYRDVREACDKWLRKRGLDVDPATTSNDWLFVSRPRAWVHEETWTAFEERVTQEAERDGIPRRRSRKPAAPYGRAMRREIERKRAQEGAERNLLGEG